MLPAKNRYYQLYLQVVLYVAFDTVQLLFFKYIHLCVRGTSFNLEIAIFIPQQQESDLAVFWSERIYTDLGWITNSKAYVINQILNRCKSAEVKNVISRSFLFFFIDQAGIHIYFFTSL